MQTAPHDPAGPSPLRRPQSVRRTSTLDTTWPQGYGKPMLMLGRARDVWTAARDAPPAILSQAHLEITATVLREIVALRAQPSPAHLERLVGVRAGGHSRAVLTEIMGDPSQAGTPLYLLLDDIPGASLVAGWAWSRWTPDWAQQSRSSGARSTAGRHGKMEGVCTGFRPGSSSLTASGEVNFAIQSATPVPPLTNPGDPWGWHELAQQTGVGMRRARRLDVWREGEIVHIDAAFQDSATAPTGGRIAVHEYSVTATTDTNDFVLRTLQVNPRILPYRECPEAAPNAQRMVGTALSEMRLNVLGTLPGTLGCTHLNDVLRCLADVPRLAAALDQKGQSK